MIGIFTYMYMNYTILRVSIVINYNSFSKASGALVSSPPVIRNKTQPVCSTLQRWRERQRASGQVVQPLLAVPGWLPAVAALPGHAGVRQAVVEVRGTTDGGLRCSHDTAAHRGRVARWTQRAGTWGGESAAWRATSAIGCPADSFTGASQKLKSQQASCSIWKDEGSTRRSLFDEWDPRDRRSMRRVWEVLLSSLRFSRDFAVPQFYNFRI